MLDYWFLFRHPQTLTVNGCRYVQILLYCDLHGHSRRQNVFMYGCTDQPDMLAANQLLQLQNRLFPFIMEQEVSDLK